MYVIEGNVWLGLFVPPPSSFLLPSSLLSFLSLCLCLSPYVSVSLSLPSFSSIPVFFNIRHSVLLCSPSWPRTHYVYQVAMELIEIHLPVPPISYLLKLKVCPIFRGHALLWLSLMNFLYILAMNLLPDIKVSFRPLSCLCLL